MDPIGSDGLSLVSVNYECQLLVDQNGGSWKRGSHPKKQPSLRKFSRSAPSPEERITKASPAAVAAEGMSVI